MPGGAPPLPAAVVLYWTQQLAYRYGPVGMGIALPSKTNRICRIIRYTASMYVVTHLIVFLFLFPVGIPLIMFDRRNGRRIKERVTGLLFAIIAGASG